MFFDCVSQLYFWSAALPRAVRGIWDTASTASAQPPALLTFAALVLLVGGVLLTRLLRHLETIQDTATLGCTQTHGGSLLARSRHVRHLYTIIVSRIALEESSLIALHEHVGEQAPEKQVFDHRGSECAETHQQQQQQKQQMQQQHAAGGAKRRERGRSRRGPMVGDRQSRARASARRRSSLPNKQSDAAEMAGVRLGKIDPVVIATAKPRKYQPAPIGQKSTSSNSGGGGSASRVLDDAADDCSGVVWSGSPLLGLQISGSSSSDYGETYGLQAEHVDVSDTAAEPSFSLFSSSFLD